MEKMKKIDDQQVDQFYTDVDGSVWPEETWETFDGRKILVKDLEPEHAKNIIRMILRCDRIQNLQYREMMKVLETLFAQVEKENSNQLLN